jgi:SAM-dependent methyltransferase
MEERHLDELRNKEISYWWHVNRRRLVLKFLSEKDWSKGCVLDLGCGGGFLSALLRDRGADVVSTDIIMGAARNVRAMGSRKALLFDAGFPWPFVTQTFQTILMLDVLEHVEDDAACLDHMKKALMPGGRVILTVPAHQFLFSRWDRILGHFRRYSKDSLQQKILTAGFQLEGLCYHNSQAFLPALLLRGKEHLGWSDLRERAEFPHVPASINSLLKGWGGLERVLAPHAVPVGLSLLAVFCSPDD